MTSTVLSNEVSTSCSPQKSPIPESFGKLFYFFCSLELINSLCHSCWYFNTHAMLVFFQERDVLLKSAVLAMFILNNSSTGCWCVYPVVGLQPAHTSRGVINGSWTTVRTASALQGWLNLRSKKTCIML